MPLHDFYDSPDEPTQHRETFFTVRDELGETEVCISLADNANPALFADPSRRYVWNVFYLDYPIDRAPQTASGYADSLPFAYLAAYAHMTNDLG